MTSAPAPLLEYGPVGLSSIAWMHEGYLLAISSNIADLDMAR
jgi:hypothetical protein